MHVDKASCCRIPRLCALTFATRHLCTSLPNHPASPPFPFPTSAPSPLQSHAPPVHCLEDVWWEQGVLGRTHVGGYDRQAVVYERRDTRHKLMCEAELSAAHVCGHGVSWGMNMDMNVNVRVWKDVRV